MSTATPALSLMMNLIPTIDMRKTLPSLLLAAALLLPAAAAEPGKAITLSPTECPSLLKPEEPLTEEERAYCHYELMTSDFAKKLRHACLHCVAVEFICSEPVMQGESVVRKYNTLTLKRGKTEPQGERLEALLYLLRVQERWYERDWDEDYCVDADDWPSVRFLAADGKSLLTVELAPGGPAYVRFGQEYISLWELCRRLLPQPDARPEDDALLKNAAPAVPRVPCISPWGMPLPDKPVYVDEKQLFCYVRTDAAANERLRRALADGTELQLDLWLGYGEHAGKHKLRFSRATTEGLSDTLRELAALPQWLDEELYTDADVEPPAYSAELILLDAAGKPLWQGDPTAVFCQPKPGESPVSLLSMLRLPTPLSGGEF